MTEVTQVNGVINLNKKISKYSLAKEIIEWLGWTTVILWGGEELYRNHCIPDKVAPVCNDCQSIFDTNNDGKLSDEEKLEAKNHYNEFLKWIKLHYML